MRYKIGSKNRSSKYLDVEIQIEKISGQQLTLVLPSWRPGRYELGNFAKNIKGFKVVNEKNKSLPFEKSDKSTWEIQTAGNKNITIQYQYYSAELNAGSTWVDEEMLYLNPVNCLMYAEGKQEEICLLDFEVPSHYIFATSLKQVKGTLYQANNYDELADSPIICSPKIKHASYKIEKTAFHLWFQGECKPNWEKIIQDFTAMSKIQLECMGSFPFKEYHFLFHLLPYKAYHGVEHLSSTVITLGPGYALMNDNLYEDFLGISSHELFHAWNVKTIRPEELFPYDFTKENYGKMGYLSEGVTTYYGDLFLVRSGLFTESQYYKQLHSSFDKHFFNYGRFNYSVGESGFDTWLDGYVKGAPNRKTSIYTEGSLLALATDIMILEATKGEKSLDDVMRILYHDVALKGKSISEPTYIKTVEEVGKIKFESWFNNHYHNALDFGTLIKKSLSIVGLELVENPNENYLAHQMGCLTEGNSGKISTVAPLSPAEKAGLHPGDEIIAVNQIALHDNCNDWCNYFSDTLQLTLKKNGKIVSVQLEPQKESYFSKFRIEKAKKPTFIQSKLLKKWLWRE